MQRPSFFCWPCQARALLQTRHALPRAPLPPWGPLLTRLCLSFSFSQHAPRTTPTHTYLPTYPLTHIPNHDADRLVHVPTLRIPLHPRGRGEAVTATPIHGHVPGGQRQAGRQADGQVKQVVAWICALCRVDEYISSSTYYLGIDRCSDRLLIPLVIPPPHVCGQFSQSVSPFETR